jgi:hypothetical protein
MQQDHEMQSQQSTPPDNMQFHADEHGNLAPQTHFSLNYDPANSSVANANIPPPIPHFLSLDLESIEWDRLLYL